MTCHCLIRHALSTLERQEAQRNLARARFLNDEVGILLSVASLGECPGSRAHLNQFTDQRNREGT